MIDQSSHFFKELFVCPLCKEDFTFLPDVIECNFCHSKYPQVAPDYINLFPQHLLTGQESQWQERQVEMERWYQDLISNPQNAADLLLHDYAPYESILKKFSGTVLDIGGGLGIAQHYMPKNTTYIVVDPSLDWLKADWKPLAKSFPHLQEKNSFVRGLGEYLPFPAESFDAALSFWSLNHACDPKRVLHEAARILRPGGHFLVVLEDMSPQWFDLTAPRFPAKDVFNSFFGQECLSGKKFPRLRLILKSLKNEQLPLQKDHLLIHESDIWNWTSNSFKVVKRVWMKQFLTFELERLGTALKLSNSGSQG